MPDSRSNRPRDPYEGLRDLGRGRRPGGEEGGEAADRLAGLKVPRRGGRRGAGRGEVGPEQVGRARVGRRRGRRRTLVAVNIVVALCLLGGIGTFAYVEYRLGQVNKISLPGLTAASSSKPFTVLIVGSDTRSLSGSGNSQFGSQAETPGQRSDTIMLVRVVPASRHISILSIPRDLWVPIKGMGDNRINSAYNTGPELLITTIQSDLGLTVNHFVEVNFDTFRDITDAVGGVKFYFPTPARDAYSLLEVPKAGCINLTGNQALGFVRSRHYQYFENGQWVTQGLSDLARIQRQQIFVKKMIKKAESKFTDPLTLNAVVGAVTKNLTVDSGFGGSLMLRLALDFRSADVAGIPTQTLPTFNETIGGAEVLGLQQPQANQMIAAFNTLGNASAKPVTPATTPATHTTTKPTTPPASPPTTWVLPGPAPTAAELAAC